MEELYEWATSRPFDDRPWLVVGKGPTFARLHEFDVDVFNILTLNQAVLEVPAHVAHIIDIDVVEDCGQALIDRARYVVMPRVPHVRNRPGFARLEDYVEANEVLQTLDRHGRLIWYNAETGPRIGSSPVVEVRYFSSEAALGVLGVLGVNEVRTIGVDGGTSYARAFSTRFAGGLLSNGQPSFDQQFGEMRRIARRFGMKVKPLVDTLRVFVGAGPREAVPYRVLAHSIHQRSSKPVRVEMLPSTTGPQPRARQNRPRTAFSFSRFLIPSLCDFEGLAVYLDSDMLVFDDIAGLFEHDLRGAALACTMQPAPEAWQRNEWFHPGRQFSVMLLDCSKLTWDLDDIVHRLDADELSYSDLMFQLAIVDPADVDDTLDPEWNSLERYHARTKLLHYTIVPTQPWLSTENPLRSLWLDAFRGASAAGAMPRAEVESLVRLGGASDLLSEFDAVAGSQSTFTGDLKDVALDAAARRIEQLEVRRIRAHVRRPLRRLSPLVRVARDRWGHSRLGTAVETVAELARRAVR